MTLLSCGCGHANQVDQVCSKCHTCRAHCFHWDEYECAPFDCSPEEARAIKRAREIERENVVRAVEEQRRDLSFRIVPRGYEGEPTIEWLQRSAYQQRKDAVG